MDILVKNMEMPKSCEDCFACHECSYESYDYCNILKAMTTRGERRNDCPLVALPEHGRLKDELDILRIFDKYLPKVDDDTNALLCEILAEIHLQAPTVLEATE